MQRSKDYLEKKMLYHEHKAIEYYNEIVVIENKDRLIGFRPKNDNRQSTDLVSIKAPVLIRPYWDYGS